MEAEDLDALSNFFSCQGKNKCAYVDGEGP